MNNGGQGITPTIELATTNGNNGYPYPVVPAYGYNNGNDGFFGDSGIWAIVLLALLFNGGFGFGGFGGGFGMMNGMYEFPWLLNGQQEIMSNTNNGFDTLHLSNQIEGVRDGVYGISNQLCNSTASVVSAVNNGFANAETSENARQIANMQQAFNSQISTLQGFNQIGTRLDDCCYENRLASCQTQNIIQNEGNATRFADANNTRDIIESANRNSQAILDKLCQLELDGKQDRINELERQILMKDLQASQVQQTADLRFANIDAVDSYGRDSYGNYERGYGRDSYGRRERDSRGRYRGHEYMDEMDDYYGRYMESREKYGANEDTKKSLEYMLRSMEDFARMLKEDAGSEEEVQMIRQTAQRIAQM